MRCIRNSPCLKHLGSSTISKVYFSFFYIRVFNQHYLSCNSFNLSRTNFGVRHLCSATSLCLNSCDDAPLVDFADDEEPLIMIDGEVLGEDELLATTGLEITGDGGAGEIGSMDDYMSELEGALLSEEPVGIEKDALAVGVKEAIDDVSAVSTVTTGEAKSFSRYLHDILELLPDDGNAVSLTAVTPGLDMEGIIEKYGHFMTFLKLCKHRIAVEVDTEDERRNMLRKRVSSFVLSDRQNVQADRASLGTGRRESTFGKSTDVSGVGSGKTEKEKKERTPRLQPIGAATFSASLEDPNIQDLIMSVEKVICENRSEDSQHPIAVPMLKIMQCLDKKKCEMIRTEFGTLTRFLKRYGLQKFDLSSDCLSVAFPKGSMSPDQVMSPEAVLALQMRASNEVAYHDKDYATEEWVVELPIDADVTVPAGMDEPLALGADDTDGDTPTMEELAVVPSLRITDTFVAGLPPAPPRPALAVQIGHCSADSAAFEDAEPSSHKTTASLLAAHIKIALANGWKTPAQMLDLFVECVPTYFIPICHLTISPQLRTAIGSNKLYRVFQVYSYYFDMKLENNTQSVRLRADVEHSRKGEADVRYEHIKNKTMKSLGSDLSRYGSALSALFDANGSLGRYAQNSVRRFFAPGQGPEELAAMGAAGCTTQVKKRVKPPLLRSAILRVVPYDSFIEVGPGLVEKVKKVAVAIRQEELTKRKRLAIVLDSGVGKKKDAREKLNALVGGADLHNSNNNQNNDIMAHASCSESDLAQRDVRKELSTPVVTGASQKPIKVPSLPVNSSTLHLVEAGESAWECASFVEPPKPREKKESLSVDDPDRFTEELLWSEIIQNSTAYLFYPPLSTEDIPLSITDPSGAQNVFLRTGEQETETNNNKELSSKLSKRLVRLRPFWAAPHSFADFNVYSEGTPPHSAVSLFLKENAESLSNEFNASLILRASTLIAKSGKSLVRFPGLWTAASTLVSRLSKEVIIELSSLARNCSGNCVFADGTRAHVDCGGVRTESETEWVDVLRFFGAKYWVGLNSRGERQVRLFTGFVDFDDIQHCLVDEMRLALARLRTKDLRQDAEFTLEEITQEIPENMRGMLIPSAPARVNEKEEVAAGELALLNVGNFSLPVFRHVPLSRIVKFITDHNKFFDVRTEPVNLACGLSSSPERCPQEKIFISAANIIKREALTEPPKFERVNPLNLKRLKAKKTENNKSDSQEGGAASSGESEKIKNTDQSLTNNCQGSKKQIGFQMANNVKTLSDANDLSKKDEKDKEKAKTPWNPSISRKSTWASKLAKNATGMTDPPPHQDTPIFNDEPLVSNISKENKTWTAAFWNTVSSNPYFHAGAGIYILTIAAVIGRLGLKMASTQFRRRFVMSMEMTNRDVSYDWLVQWLSNHPTFYFQQMSCITSTMGMRANEETPSRCIFAPSPNVPHWLFHKKRPFLVMRKRQVERAAGSDVLEILEISTIGRDRNVIIDIVNEARRDAVARDSDKTVIYGNSGGRWIRNLEPRMRRPLQSVVLSGTARDELLADVRLFLASRNYYQRLGVPYRRGYLLYGPPGNGKSSLVMALAGEMRLALCLISLSNRSLDDESLNSLLNSAPMRSIVLLEDVDRAFAADSRVTMSGALNALDGVAAQEGRLVFLTTNHVERLDAALIRPGRADVIMEIGQASRTQAKSLFCNFFPDLPNEAAERFAALLPERAVSVAQLQSHLFFYRDDAEKAIEALPAFIESLGEFQDKIEKARAKDKKYFNAFDVPLLAKEVNRNSATHDLGF